MSPEEISDLNARIDAITRKYTFTHPALLADTNVVRAEILALLPEDSSVGVNPTPRGDFVSVNVFVEKRLIYKRMMSVEGRIL